MYENLLLKENYEDEIDREKELEMIEKMIAFHKQAMIAKNEGPMAVGIIGLNGIVERKDNGFKPLINKRLSKPNNHTIIKDDTGMMKTNNYDRTLREYRESLLEYDLDAKTVAMLTTTTDYKLGVDYDTLNKYAKKYDKRLKRKFTNLIMIKRFEHSERSKVLHIHYALCFDNEIPKDLTEEWAQKTWKLGTVNITEFDKEESLVEYMAKYKFSDIDETDKSITKFPAKAHIIQSSKNIPKVSDIYNINSSKEDLERLKYLYNLRSRLKYNKELFEYKQKTKFVDNKTGEIISFINKRIYY